LATLVVVGVATGFALLYVFRTVLLILFVAAVIATAVDPAVEWLVRRKLRPVAAVAAVYGAIILAVAAVALLTIPLLVTEAWNLRDLIPGVYSRFRDYTQSFSNPVIHEFAKTLPAHPTLGVSQGAAVRAGLDGVTQTLAYVGGTFWAMFVTAAVLILAFYWSLQQETIYRWILLLVPSDRRDDARDLIAAMQIKVRGYVVGQSILCLIVGILYAIAYWLIGLPNGVALAALAGVLEAVPYLGPILGALPAVLVALTTSPYQVVWVVIAAVLIQQTENYLLVPRIMDRRVGVSPVVTLLAIFGFGTLMGVPGAILAIPLAAIIQVALDRALLRPTATEPAQPEGRDQANFLLYQTRDLIHDVQMYIRSKPDTLTTQSDRLEDAIEDAARQLTHSLRMTAGKPQAQEAP
jgi:predicted PurR-regulated permease PerM